MKRRVDSSEFLDIKQRLGVRNNLDLAALVEMHTGVIISNRYFSDAMQKSVEFSAGISAALRLLVKLMEAKGAAHAPA